MHSLSIPSDFPLHTHLQILRFLRSQQGTVRTLQNARSFWSSSCFHVLLVFVLLVVVARCGGGQVGMQYKEGFCKLFLNSILTMACGAGRELLIIHFIDAEVEGFCLFLFFIYPPVLHLILSSLHVSNVYDTQAQLSYGWLLLIKGA